MNFGRFICNTIVCEIVKNTAETFQMKPNANEFTCKSQQYVHGWIKHSSMRNARFPIGGAS